MSPYSASAAGFHGSAAWMLRFMGVSTLGAVTPTNRTVAPGWSAGRSAADGPYNASLGRKPALYTQFQTHRRNRRCDQPAIVKAELRPVISKTLRAEGLRPRSSMPPPP